MSVRRGLRVRGLASVHDADSHHVIPGMDEAAASAVADLILNGSGRKSGHDETDPLVARSEEPADPLRFRRSAGSSSSSGGRI